MPTRSIRPTVLLALILALGAAAATARGQGTSGAFPDPITVRQYSDWLESAGLDAQQRGDLAGLIEAYQEQYRALREGDIEEYLEARRGQGPFSRAPSVEAVEARVSERARLLARIGKLERELFDRTAEALAPEQVAALDRSRRRAERSRHLGTVGTFGLPGGRLDLGSAYDELELDDAARVATTPSVIEYERALTRLYRDLAEASVEQPAQLARAMAAAGIQRPDPTGGAIAADAFDEYFRARQQLAREVARPQGELRGRIARTQRGLVRSVRPVVGEDAAWALHRELVARGYPELFGDETAMDDVFTRAIEQTGEDALEPEARSALEAMRASYRASYVAVLDQMMDEIDERRTTVAGAMFMFGQEDESVVEAQERLTRLREKREGVNSSALEQMVAVVGPETGERLTARRREGESMPGVMLNGAMVEISGMADGGGVFVMDSGDGGAASMVVTMVDASGGPNGPTGGFPAPLDRRELEALLDRLALDETLQPVVELLHEEYLAAYDAARTESDDEMRSLRSRPDDDERRFVPPGTQEVERQFTARRRGLDRLQAIETGFFADLEAVVVGSGVERGASRERAVRERRWLRDAATGAQPGMMMGPGRRGSPESTIDLELLVANADLGDAALEAMAPVLVQYGESATTLARQRLETMLTGQREVALFRARSIVSGDDGEIEVRISSEDEGFETMRQAERRMADAGAAIATLNRQSMDELMAALGEADGARVLDAYQRQAFPSAYPANAITLKRFDAALALDDLELMQRQEIELLREEFVKASDSIRDQIIAAEREGGTMGMGDAMDASSIQRLQARANAMRKLRFERTELDGRMLQRLGGALTPEQTERIGGIEIPKGPQRGGIQFFGG